jgi:ankyrin repeat protein
LHLAAGEGHLDIVTMLCEAGADVNVEDRWGHRPLDEAGHAKNNSDAIMNVLLKHGAGSNNILTTIKKAFLGLTGSTRV